MSNMSLEDIIDELSKHGLPNLHPYSSRDQDKDHLKRGEPTQLGKWTCSIRVPHNLADLNPYSAKGETWASPGSKEYADRYMVPQQISGEGDTAREAAALCLDRVLLYVEHGWHYLWPDYWRPASVPVPQKQEG